MKIPSISLIAAVLAFAGCGDDGGDGNDTSGGTTAPTTTSPATDTGTPQTSTDPDSSGEDTSSCTPVMKTCEEACNALYACGVEDGNCMFTDDPDERATFVAGCMENPLCEPSSGLVNECNCAMTVMTIKGASPDFADSCDNGISAGSGGSDSGGSDTGGGSSTGA